MNQPDEKKSTNNFYIYEKTALLWSESTPVKDTNELLKSGFFREILNEYLLYLQNADDDFIKNIFKEKNENTLNYVCDLLILLNENKYIELKDSELDKLIKNKEDLIDFVNGLYDYWRNFERFLIVTSYADKEYDKKPYRTFNDTIDHMNHIIRKVYRDIVENITGDHPRIYRQVSAGFEVGMIVKNQTFECPSKYNNVKDIPFITQELLYPPLILDPPMNKRTGQFLKINTNPLENVFFKKGEWVCYPTKINDVIIHVYIHNKFISLGSSLANLFKLCEEEDIHKKPDAIYAFGIEEGTLNHFGDIPTVFYDDLENELLVAAVPRDDAYGYFGYLKKMMLTLHNAIIMKRKRLPIHGAMVEIVLKNGKKANIVIVGDSGAGKSESLEAFRLLGKEHLKKITIIFDDMGSLGKDKEGNVIGYGTEIGAFVRLDDLQPGFAFGNIDRSIIMSPEKINARALLPITTFENISKGVKIDFFLYANNYEEVTKKNYITKINTKEEALDIFREGKIMSKGTTTTTGLVSNYFANIFGPPQYKELHETLAEEYFNILFEKKVYVGQLRTQLGIKGKETDGSIFAAKALFKMINDYKKN